MLQDPLALIGAKPARDFAVHCLEHLESCLISHGGDDSSDGENEEEEGPGQHCAHLSDLGCLAVVDGGWLPGLPEHIGSFKRNVHEDVEAKLLLGHISVVKTCV